MTKGKRGGKISPATQFKPGRSGNPSGRPRKYVSLSEEQADKLSQINQCIQAMMTMELSDLTAVLNNPAATILEKTVASAMLRSLEKGSLSSVQTLLNRLYGTPGHTVGQNNTMKINVRFNKDE
jgi:hypothetical protein